MVLLIAGLLRFCFFNNNPMNSLLTKSLCLRGLLPRTINVSRRLFSVPSVQVTTSEMPLEIRKAVKEAEKEAISYKSMKTQKSTFSQRISPFLWGFVLASFVGMYFLIQDLNKSDLQLYEAIAALKNDVNKDIEDLDERVEKMRDQQFPV